MSEKVPGRRQERKDEIKNAIVEAAHGLFEKHGFDQVTVAEVAKKAGTTVKTLFTYFHSKEDLVFEREMDLMHRIIEELRRRRRGISVASEFRKSVTSLLNEAKGVSALESLEGFERMTENAVLKSRLQIMWLKYEDCLCEFLRHETQAEPGDAKPRLAAVQLVSLIRLLTGPEAKFVASRGSDTVEKWFAKSAKLFCANIESYARK